MALSKWMMTGGTVGKSSVGHQQIRGDAAPWDSRNMPRIKYTADILVFHLGDELELPGCVFQGRRRGTKDDHSQMLHVSITMVLVYLPTKLGDFGGICVGKYSMH